MTRTSMLCGAHRSNAYTYPFCRLVVTRDYCIFCTSVLPMTDSISQLSDQELGGPRTLIRAIVFAVTVMPQAQ